LKDCSGLKKSLIDEPTISDEKGRELNSSTIDQGMYEVLEELYRGIKNFSD
jgi:hypothetical protein